MLTGCVFFRIPSGVRVHAGRQHITANATALGAQGLFGLGEGPPIERQNPDPRSCRIPDDVMHAEEGDITRNDNPLLLAPIIKHLKSAAGMRGRLGLPGSPKVLAHDIHSHSSLWLGPCANPPLLPVSQTSCDADKIRGQPFGNRHPLSGAITLFIDHHH